MSRGVKYSVGEKKFMTSLVRHFGLTGARNVLKRMANVSMVTLGKLADQADIKLTRGRPGVDGVVIVKPRKARKVQKQKNLNRSRRFTDEQRAEFIELIKVNGLTGTQNILAERGVQITLTTLQKLGKLASIKLHRGRPAVKQEQVAEVAVA